MTDTAHYQLPMTAAALAELAPLFDALAAVAIRGEVPGPELLARVAQAQPMLSAVAQLPNDGEPYSRSILRVDDEVEIMLARWRSGHGCAPHDHGGAGGFVIPVEGAFVEPLLIDPAERLAAAIAQRYPHTRKTSRRGMRVFLTTGDPEAMRRGAVHAWGTALTAKVVRA